MVNSSIFSTDSFVIFTFFIYFAVLLPFFSPLTFFSYFLIIFFFFQLIIYLSYLFILLIFFHFIILLYVIFITFIFEVKSILDEHLHKLFSTCLPVILISVASEFRIIFLIFQLINLRCY